MNACTLLLVNRCFFVIKVDMLCIRQNLVSVVEVFARKVFNHESDRFREPDVRAAAKVFG